MYLGSLPISSRPLGQRGGFGMSDISVIGLGAMGSALARALVRARLRVTVWNRTAPRMEPLLAAGVDGAGTLASAVQASPLVLICIDDYAATKRLLGATGVSPHLSGRTLIQLTTGTPREARESEAWAGDVGAGYVEGKILGGPARIGTEGGMILGAGTKAAFAACESAMRSLGGDLRYLGERIGAPAALDLAWLSERFGSFVGAAHGARLCEAEGVGIDLYASLFAEGQSAKRFADVIHRNAYENPSATLQVWTAALERIQDHAHDVGINREVPDFVMGILKRAIAAGHGREHVAALSKVLKQIGGAES
jgi:3-hydroxyisobutyrate dehydrogenase-like beta-hydroxyacid dehydrogenase